MDEHREGDSSSESSTDDPEEAPPTESEEAESSPTDDSGADGSSSTDGPSDEVSGADDSSEESPDSNAEESDSAGTKAGDADAEESETAEPAVEGSDSGESDDEGSDADSEEPDTEESETSESEESGESEETAPPGTQGVEDESMSEFADSMGPESPEDETTEETDESADLTSIEETTLGPDEAEVPTADEGEPGFETTFEEESGPGVDQEMPLAVHIREMVRRLLVVIAVAGVVTLIAYPLSEELLAYLWQTHIPNPLENRPRVYGPLEFILTKLKIASLSGTLAGLPVLVYQSYRFMRPGLYPHERRYYLAAVPTSLILALVGVTFAHFVVLPSIFVYFTSYTKDAAIVAYGLRETFNLILVLMGYMAIVFQIPLFVMLATMMDLVSREWMEDKRLLFWGSFAGLAFLVSPDPTGMAPIIIAATMVVLFEGTLALMRWTGH